MSLTERLRIQKDAWNGLCLEAADEIERLRGEAMTNLPTQARDLALAMRVYDKPATAKLLTELADEIERLTRDRDATAAELLRVIHDARCCYRCARKGEKLETTIQYLEEPEADHV